MELAPAEDDEVHSKSFTKAKREQNEALLKLSKGRITSPACNIRKKKRGSKPFTKAKREQIEALLKLSYGTKHRSGRNSGEVMCTSRESWK